MTDHPTDQRQHDERLKQWTALRLAAKDITEDLELITRKAQAFETAVMSAYATNAEMIATPEVEALDLAMLRRLHDYLHEGVGFVVDDAAQASEILTAFETSR
jgi:hypothetical protein